MNAPALPDSLPGLSVIDHYELVQAKDETLPYDVLYDGYTYDTVAVR